jgi:ubiquinol-cytochrome c reductase cytochrome b subunit
VLGWCGAQRPEGIPLIVGRIATVYYFLHFLVLLPLVSKYEKPRPLPESISEPVLKGARS